MQIRMLCTWALLICVAESLMPNSPQVIDQANNDTTSSPPRLALPSLSGDPTTSTTSMVNQSSAFLDSYVKYTCDYNRYGRPNSRSCHNAMRYMPIDQIAVSYGDRVGTGQFDVTLPARYSSGMFDMLVLSMIASDKMMISDDGTCIIEIQASQPGVLDSMTPELMKVRAKYLIDKCVKAWNSGGVGEYLGHSICTTLLFRKEAHFFLHRRIPQPYALPRQIYTPSPMSPATIPIPALLRQILRSGIRFHVYIHLGI